MRETVGGFEGGEKAIGKLVGAFEIHGVARELMDSVEGTDQAGG